MRKLVMYLIMIVLLSVAAPLTAAKKAEPCKGSEFLAEALQLLPEHVSVPCDEIHLVSITNIEQFLKEHPELEKNGQAGRARTAFAFVGGEAKWPIYIRADRVRKLGELAKDEPWMIHLLAGVILHEWTHAMGEPKESPALMNELGYVQAQPGVPAEVVKWLTEQYQAALARDQRASSPR